MALAAVSLMTICGWLLLSSPAAGSHCDTPRETVTLPHKVLSATTPPLRRGPKSRNITIVTAFFNLGPVQKGSEAVTRGPSTYRTWMWPYRHIENGVVAYFDDPLVAAEFSEQRRSLPTKVVIVNRSELWAFSTVNRSHQVFIQPDYPKNSPKSTNPDYVAAMHAKYELVARAVKGDDPFGSSYVAWMDLGIYRTLPTDATSSFTLRAPHCLHDDAVMFARIFPMANDYTLQSVMRNGHDWVGGGFFIARRDVLVSFYDDYSRHVESYLEQNLSNHDQSVLLAMYLPTASPRPAVPLQTIVPTGSDNPWFHMALQARRDGLQATGSVIHASGTHVSCSFDMYM